MRTVERAVSRVLFWGAVLAIALMLLGLIGYAVRVGIRGETLNIARLSENREAGVAADVFTSVPAVVRALESRPIDPLAVTTLGILLLLATPFLAVLTAIPLFVRCGDRRYALIASVLGAVLIVSLFVGHG